MLQFGQLEVVPLESLGVLVHFPELILQFLEGRLGKGFHVSSSRRTFEFKIIIF